MPGLKKHDPSFRFSENKVTPDELDMYIDYTVMNPSIDPAYIGTVSSASPATFVLTNTRLDYPRSILWTCLGVAGGMGGTATINGTDQFGRTIQESIVIGSAAGGGTAASTAVFATVTSGTVRPNGLGGTAIGTSSLGVAVGTANGIQAKFGLPCKIQSTGDVKSLTWINQGTATPILGGTVSSLIGTTAYSFRGTAAVTITDVYRIRIKPTYDASNDTNVI